MYSLFTLFQKYLGHYFTASNGKGHGIHSPFVFEFITRVLNDKKKYPAFDVVEALRQRLLNHSAEIVVEDFGAGSAVDKSDRRTIASIAKNASKTPKYGQLLYRMVRYYQPRTILELGTSLGITTSYLSLAKPDAEITTMEGASSVAAAAIQNFGVLGLANIKVAEGNFDALLPPIVSKQATIDFVFVDGNHRLQPTMNYFNVLLTRINPNSILVFDDIHWSREMEMAWQAIKNHKSVKCSIDLFFIGIIFFRDDFKEQQHFKIRV